MSTCSSSRISSTGASISAEPIASTPGAEQSSAMIGPGNGWPQPSEPPPSGAGGASKASMWARARAQSEAGMAPGTTV